MCVMENPPSVSPMTTTMLMVLDGVVVQTQNNVNLDVVTVIQMMNVRGILSAVQIIAKTNFQLPEPNGTRKLIAVLVCINIYDRYREIL